MRSDVQQEHFLVFLYEHEYHPVVRVHAEGPTATQLAGELMGLQQYTEGVGGEQFQGIPELLFQQGIWAMRFL
jgi:hypothetical protein